MPGVKFRNSMTNQHEAKTSVVNKTIKIDYSKKIKIC